MSKVLSNLLSSIECSSNHYSPDVLFPKPSRSSFTNALSRQSAVSLLYVKIENAQSNHAAYDRQFNPPYAISSHGVASFVTDVSTLLHSVSLEVIRTIDQRSDRAFFVLVSLEHCPWYRPDHACLEKPWCFGGCVTCNRSQLDGDRIPTQPCKSIFFSTVA